MEGTLALFWPCSQAFGAIHFLIAVCMLYTVWSKAGWWQRAAIKGMGARIAILIFQRLANMLIPDAPPHPLLKHNSTGSCYQAHINHAVGFTLSMLTQH